jgi:5'-deoxynucleotidase YfbR-like HD superfamily hydrolase
MDPFDRLNKIRCGGNVERFHVLPTIRRNSVAAHSWGVAVVCLSLWDDCSFSLVKAALYHDCAEYLTGDLPAPIKLASEQISSVIRTLEKDYEEELNIRIPLSEKDKARLKFADCVDGAMFCLEEIKMGNKMVVKPFAKYIDYLNAVEMENCTWLIQALTKEAAQL